MARFFIHEQEVKMGIPEAVALEKCVTDAGCETAYKKRSAGTITHISDLLLARDNYGLDGLSAVLPKMRTYWPTERIYTATMLGLLKVRELMIGANVYTDELFEDVIFQCSNFFESSERLHLDIKDEFEAVYPTNYKGMGVREKIASGIIDAYEQLSGNTLVPKPFAINMPRLMDTVEDKELASG
jgi:hypothetical protein